MSELTDFLMFFINTMYQSILSWMALGLASIIGIIELGTFKKKSVKSLLFVVLYSAFIVGLSKVYDHWRWIGIYRRELELYSGNYSINNNSTQLIFPSTGNVITKIFDKLFNLPYRYDWFAFVSFLGLLIFGVLFWVENCCNLSIEDVTGWLKEIRECNKQTQNRAE